MIFQLVPLVNTDLTADKYVDIATTNQTNTTEMGFVERDVKSVIGTMSVKHVQQFSL